MVIKKYNITDLIQNKHFKLLDFLRNSNKITKKFDNFINGLNEIIIKKNNNGNGFKVLFKSYNLEDPILLNLENSDIQKIINEN